MKKISDSNSKYHSAKGISASGLKVIFNQSVFHYVNYIWKPPTPAMNFGTAVHSIMLGDTTQEIVILPELNLRTKLGREERDNFYFANKKKTVISQSEHEAIEQIMEVLNKKPQARELIENLTEIEESYYSEYDGVPVRIRPDGLKQDKYIIDIKTAQDSTPIGFRRSIYNFCYHLQAVFYSDMLGYDPEEFKFIVVESKPPYNIEVYSMNEELIDRGRKAWQIAFNEYKEYYDNGSVNGCHWETRNENGIMIL